MRVPLTQGGKLAGRRVRQSKIDPHVRSRRTRNSLPVGRLPHDRTGMRLKYT